MNIFFPHRLAAIGLAALLAASCLRAAEPSADGPGEVAADFINAYVAVSL